MSKKTLPVLLLGAFILLIILATYLFIRLRNKELATKTPTTSTEIERVVQEPTSPIKKFIPPEGNVIVYEVEGKLVGKLDTRGVLLRGEMVIRGDPLERKIPIYIGAVDGTSPFGRYQSSFSGDSTWEKTALSAIAEEIQPNEPVIIMVRYPITGQASDLKSRKHEEILDGLIKEFANEEFDSQLPTDFELTAVRIGVIR
jgi:hypothetical protein